MSPCQWCEVLRLRCANSIAVVWRIRPGGDGWAGVNAGRWLAFLWSGAGPRRRLALGGLLDGVHFRTCSLALRPRGLPDCRVVPSPFGMLRPAAASGISPFLDISAAAIKKLTGEAGALAPVRCCISGGSIGAIGIIFSVQYEGH